MILHSYFIRLVRKLLKHHISNKIELWISSFKGDNVGTNFNSLSKLTLQNRRMFATCSLAICNFERSTL